MKIALIDLETSGLDPDNNAEVIEIGAVVFDSETLEISKELDVKVKPDFDWLGDPKAYEVNGYTKEAWANALPKERALAYIKPYVDGAVFMAYNNTFDWMFMRALMKETKTLDFFHYRKLCVLSMAYAVIPHDKIKNWKLSTVCEFFSIPPEPAVHRAVNGAKCAFEVYKKIVELNSF